METFLKLITTRLFSIANARALRSPELLLQTLPFSHLQACLKDHYQSQLKEEEGMSVIRLSDVGEKKTHSSAERRQSLKKTCSMMDQHVYIVESSICLQTK